MNTRWMRSGLSSMAAKSDRRAKWRFQSRINMQTKGSLKLYDHPASPVLSKVEGLKERLTPVGIFIKRSLARIWEARHGKLLYKLLAIFLTLSIVPLLWS